MLITLTTDFGLAGPYVAAMKGVMLSINPSATIVDVSHAVRPQDVRGGALLLADTVHWFPAGTIHVAVVDPGVGTARRIIAFEAAGQRFIGPDNGLFSRITAVVQPERIVAVEHARYRLAPTSATFHGRDIMAPAAAHLSLGLDLDALGPRIDLLASLEWREPEVQANRLLGEVESIDAFGNLITNLRAGHLEALGMGSLTIASGGATILGLLQTYGQGAAGELAALLGSSGRLELAVVGGSAAARLNAQVGDEVVVRQAAAR
jgi:S-adenosylmethionine hydrolase